MIKIRPEKPEDIAAIFDLHTKAFAGDAEARLVDLLRLHNKAVVSLIAEFNDKVVGHVLFSPVELIANGNIQYGLGLAPVSVLPEHQGQGIGKDLITKGLDIIREQNHPFIVVLGNPNYYSRFGFTKASDSNVKNEYDADDSFMIMEIQAGGIPKTGGLARYAPEFSEIGA